MQAFRHQIKRVICLGDSHTQGGMYGASYVRLLAAKHAPQLTFVNAGCNGEVSQLIAARLPGLLQQHRPSAVLILAGSNDSIACQSREMQGMYDGAAAKAGVQLTPCSLDGYLQNMASMLKQMQGADCQAIVVTMPPLTEDPQNPANITAQQFNTALKQMLSRDFAQGSKPVLVADFAAACQEHLQQHSAAYRQQQQQRFQWTVWRAMWWMLSGRFMHSILRMPWNSISRRRGLCLLTDQIHLNDTGAELLAGLLEPALQKVANVNDSNIGYAK